MVANRETFLWNFFRRILNTLSYHTLAVSLSSFSLISTIIISTMGFTSTIVDTPFLTIGGSRKRRRDSEKETYSLLPSSKRLTNEASAHHHSKRVRFATSSSDEKEQEVLCIYYPPDSHTQLQKQDLWWRKDERAEITKSCREIYQDFFADHSSQVRRYESIMEKCETPSQSPSEFLDTITLSPPDYIRGLEWGILPVIRHHRLSHVQTVLQAQERIRGQLSSKLMSRVLSTRSVRSSRPCRVLARLLGEGDASSLYGKEDGEDSASDDNSSDDEESEDDDDDSSSTASSLLDSLVE